MSDIYRIFENMQDVILVVDGDRNLHFGNEAAALLLDVSVRRLRGGRPLTNFFEFSPDILESGEVLNNVDGATQMREVQFKTPAGHEGWAQVSIQSLPDPIVKASGAESGRWLLYFRDVSLEKTLHEKYKGELDQKEGVIEDLKKARNELENYSKNLEKMVEARTVELREANRLITTILNSLGQGIFVFNSKGTILPFHSKVTVDMFGQDPGGQSVAKVLDLQSPGKETFDKWMEAVFAEMLDFQDLAPLAPSRLSRGEEKHIALDFHPMRDEDRNLQGVVLVATDKTAEMLAKKEAERERSFAKRIVQVVQHRQQFRMFASEASRICEDLLAHVTPDQKPDLEATARHLHTIKGGAASFTLLEIAETAHHCEDLLTDHVRAQGQGIILTQWPEALCGELVQGVLKMRKSLTDFMESHSFLAGNLNESAERTVEIPAALLAKWNRSIQDPTGARGVSREILENWVMEPAEKAFSHVDGSLKELSEQLGKQLLPLQIVGGDIRVLPEAFAELFPTFIHAFRNAVDHGLEKPEDRQTVGKPLAGQITLTFGVLDINGRRNLKIAIRDDGKGIDPEKIRKRLLEKGIPFDADESDEEIIQAVFRDDFSTAQEVTDISGRGVGLSAVKSQAEKMGGSCMIRSVLGEGSVLTVIVPDTSLAFDEQKDRASARINKGTRRAG